MTSPAPLQPWPRPGSNRERLERERRRRWARNTGRAPEEAPAKSTGQPVCRTCGGSRWTLRARSSGGRPLQRYCMDCHARQQREWRAAQGDAYREHHRQYEALRRARVRAELGPDEDLRRRRERYAARRARERGERPK